MPNPIAIPAGKLSITEAENTEAEAFLSLMLQVFRSGTQGASITTPPTVLPVRDARFDGVTGKPQVSYLTLDTADKQLFFRQLAVAMAKAFSPSNIVIPPPPPYLAQTYTSAGVSKGDGVYLSSTGVVSRGNCIDDTHALIIGLARTNAANAESVSVLAIGTFQGLLTGATVGTEYFLGPTGQPVLLSSISSGQRLIRLGIASSSTDLEVRIMDLGVR